MDKNLLNFGYFRLARLMSRHSPFEQRFKMGAVISARRPLGMGYNKLKTAGAKYPKLFSVHAELSALINAQADIENCDIWIYRETMDGVPALAFPCKTCYDMLASAGIRRIYYSVAKAPYYLVEEL